MPPDKPPTDVHSEETILFLFLVFGILILLILILLLLGLQTYFSYRVAHILIEDPSSGSHYSSFPSSASAISFGGTSSEKGTKKGFRIWEKQRKERKRALRELEKGGRRSWGYAARPLTDEGVGMTGARGSSMALDKFSVGMEKGEKRGVWGLKRWI